ncbi:MAG: methyltransferase domain-containing protein [Hyphomicrobiaceae bacterium]|nr:methyltransferase domain-containing protein [Hyphomicrobiaceae bacterium]
MNRKQRRAAAAGKGHGGADAAHAEYVAGHGLHERGDLVAAKSHYMRALALDPDNSGSLLGMGLIARAQKMLEEAEDFLRHASEVDPSDPTILSNFAAVLVERANYAEAIRCCEQALTIEPRNYEALCNLSFAQRHSAQFAEAIVSGRKALALRPDLANAYIAIGTALVEQPDKSPAELDEALALLLKAQSIDATLYDKVELGIATVMLNLGHAKGVIDALANRDSSDFADTDYYRLLTTAYLAMQDYPNAVMAAQKYCEAEPELGHAQALLSVGMVNLKQYDAALQSARRALELDPELHTLKLDTCQIRQLLADWDGLVEAQRDVIDFMLETELIAGPFHMISMPEPSGSAANQLRCAEIFQRRITSTNKHVKPLSKGKQLNDRLKIGYLSNDYRDHATASLMSELIERHDRSHFEIYAYCYSANDESGFRRRLQNAFDQFIDVNPMTMEETAKTIQRDGIDILVDLKGFTQGSRGALLIHQPAPIQVNFLGYPGTLGAEYVDYIIGDEFLTPLDSQKYYSEKIVQLPNCYQPNDTQRAVDEYLMRREDLGLPPTGFVFCSFNNINKLTREVFQIWMRLLNQVPGSVLWLLTVYDTVKINLRKEAAACGVDPSRIIFAPMVGIPTHIARMGLADLFLDSYPCTAHTTASESLWAGLPLLTCAGETFASRVAGSILTAGGLPELVVTNLQDYESTALKLAQSPQILQEYRKRLERVSRTPLFDIATYTQDLERAYIQMAALYTNGKDPEAFAVRDLPEHPSLTKPNLAAETPRMNIQELQSTVRAVAASQPEYIDARVNYEFCPLCYSQNTSSLGASDIERHPLYKPQLPPTMPWCLCKDCRHVFTEGFFNEEAYTLLYPRTPAAELAGFDAERQRLISSKIVHRVSQLAPQGIWLDVGFGNGSLLFTASEFGYHSVGLDIRADNISAMKEFGIEAHELCIEQYKPNRPCSVISMVNVLQHLPFPGSAIEHASQLLAPNGVLFMVMPNMDTALWRLMDKQQKNPFWTDLETYHHFTRQRLYGLLDQYGLVPVEYSVSERFRSSMEVLAVKVPPKSS